MTDPIRPLAVDWIPQNVLLPKGGEHDGFCDFEFAPHIRGVLQAWDDPNVDEITLCWASRMQKTTTVLALAIYCLGTTEENIAIRDCDDASSKRTAKELFMPMLQRSLFIDKTIRITPPQYRFVIEADKWVRPRFDIEDPVRNFLDFEIGARITKAIKESVPSTMEHSRVWRDLTAKTTDQRQYYVQCPRCKEFQTLDFGAESTTHGIKWEKPSENADRNVKKEAARKTAWYQCKHNKCRILDSERPAMMRTGIWVSNGQKIRYDGTIFGEPLVRSTHIGFGPLGSEYSLLIRSWGEIAADFMDCDNNPEYLHCFQNSHRARPWIATPA